MNEVKDTATLNAEIRRLRSAIRDKEQDIKNGIAGYRDSLKFPGIFLNSFTKGGSHGSQHEEKKTFAGQVVKAGISLLLGRLFISAGEKAEQKVYDTIDTGIDKLRSIWERKFKKAKRDERI